ncbi:hypothetical protein Poli38472_003683 [Pythium oligandrum]|uniref:Uncharacterized protein n=1 Tax=Pythium oligandrum TaxID=41045 RepID=A0A8K1CPA7_PYTOL|nr:hypothetical protein Poli38472_003683 [Pythium oligandrum]|eukprot:TMW65918.1 hypothetical protein Poli38472_003683 [Pythium oligandrum]
MRRQLELVERERDAAIDEAAQAICALRRLQKEHETLQCESRQLKATVEREEMSSRQFDDEQVLWHIGHIAETLWHAMADSIENSTEMTVETARVLAIETFASMASVSEMESYEQIHRLYEDLAQAEAQKTKLIAKIRELKRCNDELEQESRRILLAVSEQRDGQWMAFNGDARHTLAALADTEDECGSAVSPHEYEAPVWPLPKPRSDQRSAHQADAETQTLRTEDDQCIDYRSAIELLQAQLAMYIRYNARQQRIQGNPTEE